MSPRSFLLATLLALAAAPAVAAPPSDARIDELLEVTRARQTLDLLLPQVEASQRQTIEQLRAQQPLTADQDKAIDTALRKSLEQIRKILSWEKLGPVYRDVYRQTFDAEDVDAMIAFYRTPSGQKMLDKMPQLMHNTMAAVQKMMAPALQEMQREIAEETRAAARNQDEAAAKDAPRDGAQDAP
ncbi:DUF2059 domain-containing protein [Luteimonas aquatica]|uniref:DUF2059 domain-containing protein n=1 Tax=Luteimonas aquatica TaxID=450364 RepID=UPI001F5A371F|nr:DUF2059 domain-containing protein [Luteimonas aquatica]